MVSVIIPTYNREHCIERPLNSVLAQTFTDWELIVVDDGGTDNTETVVKRWSRKTDRPVRYIKNKRSKGVAGARNHGITEARGEYIAFLDSDDAWLTHHLEDCARALKENKDLRLCGALTYTIFEESGRKTDAFNTDKRYDAAVAALNPALKDNLAVFDVSLFEYNLTQLFFPHINTVVMEKKQCLEGGLFDENLEAAEDMGFILNHMRQYRTGVFRDYHLLYYQGQEDSLYAFMNRKETPFYNITDPEIISKITRHGQANILLWQKMIPVVRETDAVKDKNKAVKILKNRIAHKAAALCYFSREISFYNSLRRGLTALSYGFTIRRCFIIFSRLLFKNRRLGITTQDISTW